MIKYKSENNIGIITLNRPEKRNALHPDMVKHLKKKLDEVEIDDNVKVLIITGEGKAFCAGADLKEIRERMEMADGPDRMYSYVAGIQRLYARIERLPLVTVAEIGGAAMGGGRARPPRLARKARRHRPRYSRRRVDEKSGFGGDGFPA